jgi:hypothetical protein
MNTLIALCQCAWVFLLLASIGFVARYWKDMAQ